MAIDNQNILNSPIESILSVIENKPDYKKILKIFRGKTVGEFLNRDVDKKKRVFNIHCNEPEMLIRESFVLLEVQEVLSELSKTIEIPYYEGNENYTLKQKIDLFLSQYVEKLQYSVKGKEYATYISQSFGLNGIPKTNEEIANSLPKKLTGERVRQKIAKAMDILNGKEFLNIKINSVFLDEITELKTNSLYRDANNFKKLIGSDNATTEEVRQIANIIALEITGIGDDISYMTDQQFIVNKDEVVIFKGFIKKIVNLLRDKFLPLSQNDIINKLDKNKNHIEIVESILHHHNWIEVVVGSDNINYYQLKWENLSFVSSKAKRIIFEAKKPIHKDEILKEYNRRSKTDFISKEQLIIKQEEKDNFHAQKNGYYYYSEERKQSIRDFIGKYIRDNDGKVYFDDVLLAVKNENYKYPENTIRTYINSICFISKDNLNLFIHKDFRHIYPDIEIQELRQQNVGNTIVNMVVDYLKQLPNNTSKQTDCINYIYNSKTLNLEKGNIGQYIQKLLIDTDIVIRKGTARQYELTLDLEQLQNIDLESIGKRNREPEWRKKVRALVINDLKRQSDYKALLSVLYKKFRNEIPDEISNNVFYKIFDDNQLFQKEGSQQEKYIVLNWNLLPPAKPYTEDVSEPIELIPSAYPEQEKIIYEPFDLDKLKVILFREVKGYFDENIDVSLAINTFIEYLKINNELTPWGNGILRSIYDLFVSKTDYYDRDSYLYRIVMNYEAYLKNIKKVKDNDPNINVLGLYNSLDLFTEVQFLKERDSYDNSTIQGRFAKHFRTLHYYRNKFGHDANKLEEFSLFKQVKVATDNIALYVYTAWILRN